MDVDFNKIPRKPGVYWFKDKDNKVLYVGKATSLRSRVKQYFRDPVDVKTEKMIVKAVSVDWTETTSEAMATVIEAKLIKQYKPKYNVQLKDGKRHLYLGITEDDYPRLKVVRRPELEDLKFWAGPFPSSAALKQLLRWIRQIFPYCSCSAGRKRPCLYYQIDLCPGPGIVSKEKYMENINNIIKFFSGKSEELLDQLKNEMKKFADSQRFEQAQEIKDQIDQLERIIYSSKRLSGQELEIDNGLKTLKKILIENQGVDPFYLQRIEAYDIANLSDKLIVGAMTVLMNGEINTSEYRMFKVRRQGQDDPRALAEIIIRRLNHEEWLYPQLILVDGGRPQLKAVVPVLRQFDILGETGLIGLAKEKETLVIPKIQGNKIVGVKRVNLPKNSPALKLLQVARDEAHRFAQKYLHKKLQLD
jgi:excinuclease ABC subunit C